MAEKLTIPEILEKKRTAEAEQSTIGLETKIENYRRIIEAELDPDFVTYKEKYGRSCLDDPFLLSLVEFLVAEETVAIFGTEPFIAVEGFEDADKEGAKKMSSLLRYQFYEDATQFTIISWLIAAHAYPAAVIKSTWDFVEQAPKIEYVPLETMFFSPNSTGPLNKLIPWEMQESWVDIDELKAAKDASGKDLYSNLKDLDDALGKRPTKSTAAGERFDRFTQEERKRMVYLLEFWSDTEHAAVANETVFIIEPRENPYKHGRKPYIVMNDWPRLYSPYGISTIEKCYDSYRELVTRKNQRIDNINQGINFGWYVNDQAQVDVDALVEWDRGRIVRGSAPMGEAMGPLTPNINATALAFRETEEARRGMQDATHAYAYARGETPIRKETATGLQQLVAASSIVFRFKIMTKENAAIKELAAMVGALNQQFLPDEKIIRILGSELEGKGNQYATISREDIQGRYDYIAKGSAVDPEIGKPMKRSQMLQYMQTLQPAAEMGLIPPMFFLEYAMILANQFEVPEMSILAKKYMQPAIQQQEQMQMMQKLQQMMQMGGGGGPGGPGGGRRGMPGVPAPGQAGPEMGQPSTVMKQNAGAFQTP
jgi:hypothetical protein|tara:strand:+ start:3638 stop:5431 length:1794 start_codon:yes stop_codon:yes gene_type:complete